MGVGGTGIGLDMVWYRKGYWGRLGSGSTQNFYTHLGIFFPNRLSLV